jgi:hypothetical protein
VSISNQSDNKYRHKRRRYRTLNSVDDNLGARTIRNHHAKEREIDVFKEPQALKLLVGDYGLYNSNNAFYTVK